MKINYKIEYKYVKEPMLQSKEVRAFFIQKMALQPKIWEYICIKIQIVGQKNRWYYNGSGRNRYKESK